MDVNLALLGPELALVATAILVILGDAFAPRGLGRPAIYAIAGLGIVASAVLAVRLLGVDVTAFYGALAVDTYAIYFMLLFLAATTLVLLSATGFIDSLPRYRAEFVGLLLLATT